MLMLMERQSGSGTSKEHELAKIANSLESALSGTGRQILCTVQSVIMTAIFFLSADRWQGQCPMDNPPN